MKNVLHILYIFLIVSVCLIAQERAASGKIAADRPYLLGKVQVDTLDYASEDGVIFITIEEGYLNGTNEFDDMGKYQRFDISGSNTITHAYMAFGGVEIRPAGAPDIINLVVRAVNTDGSPGTLLGSREISTAEFDTTVWNIFEFDAPISYNDTFFIGIEWNTLWADDNSDRFGLVSDEIGQGGGAKRAWEWWSDSSFNSIHDSWNDGQMDIDLWLGVIFDPATAISPLPEIIPASYALSQNYPNPFNPGTKISYTIPYESNVKIVVYNTLGEMVSEIVNSVQQPGAYLTDFNASALPSGLYLYKIEATALDGSEKFLQAKKMMLLK